MADGQILFVGDSLIAFYDWQQYFTGYDCVNLGVPGETVAGWLQLTAQAANRCPEPQYLVVMLGANNLCQQDYSFFPDYQTLLAEFRNLFPETRIVVCSLLPHELAWLASSAVGRLNDQLRPLAEERGCLYLDVCAAFLAQPGACFVEDGVHISGLGYGEWCKTLELLLAGCDSSS